MFGRQRLEKIVRDNAHRSAEELVDIHLYRGIRPRRRRRDL